MLSDAKEWQTLRNPASNGPVWPHLDNVEQACYRLWSINDFVHIEAEVRNRGLRYQVMAGIALWGKIEQI